MQKSLQLLVAQFVFWLHKHTASGQRHECSAPSASFGTLTNFLVPVAKSQTRHHGQCLGRAGGKVFLGFKQIAGPGSRVQLLALWLVSP